MLFDRYDSPCFTAIEVESESPTALPTLLRCDPATIPQSTAESAMDEFVKRLKRRCNEQTPH